MREATERQSDAATKGARDTLSSPVADGGGGPARPQGGSGRRGWIEAGRNASCIGGTLVVNAMLGAAGVGCELALKADDWYSGGLMAVYVWILLWFVALGWMITAITLSFKSPPLRFPLRAAAVVQAVLLVAFYVYYDRYVREGEWWL